jgi:hypothetical protein
METGNEERESSHMLEALQDGMSPGEEEPDMVVEDASWETPAGNLGAIAADLERLRTPQAADPTVPRAEPSRVDFEYRDPAGDGDAPWAGAEPTNLEQLYEQAASGSARALRAPASTAGLASAVGLTADGAAAKLADADVGDGDAPDQVTFERTVGRSAAPARASTVAQVALPPGVDAAETEETGTDGARARWSQLPRDSQS